METQYNYQIRSRSDKKEWEDIEAINRSYGDRVTALIFGRRLARLFEAEVRMTEGKDPMKTSGTYIMGDGNR